MPAGPRECSESISRLDAAVDDEELGQLLDAIPCVPAVGLREDIGSDDERPPNARILGDEVLEGHQRATDSAEFALYVTHSDSFPKGSRCASAHGESVLVGRQRFVEGVLQAGHEPYLVHATIERQGAHVLMRDVGWVEGAAEHTDMTGGGRVLRIRWRLSHRLRIAPFESNSIRFVSA